MAANTALQTLSIILQVVIILTCLIIGAKKGGIALGLIAGIGLLVLVFGFRLEPGEAPVDVILTILAVIGCAATLQQSGGLDVMMQVAERILRRHPEQITILGPCVTWFLTVLCGTGHVVYTMLPIIADIAIKKNIRPERPMAASSVAAQMGITASPVSVATVSIVSIIAKNTDRHWSVLQILAISIPASLCGVLLAALWSMRRGKDLDEDEEYQKRLENPEFRATVHSSSETLIGKVFPPQAYRATWIFLGAIAVVVILGALEVLRPQFPTGDNGAMERLSMNLVIQMVMLAAGALTDSQMEGWVWVVSPLICLIGVLPFVLWGLAAGMWLPSSASIGIATSVVSLFAFIGNAFMPLSHTLLTISRFTPMYGATALARWPLGEGWAYVPDRQAGVQDPLWMPLANLVVWTLIFGLLVIGARRRATRRR